MSPRDQLVSQRMRSTSWIMTFVLMVFVVSLSLGCDGEKDSTVSGRVTIDGQPMSHGSVVFINAVGAIGAPASGQIQSDGSYEMQIGRSGELIAGEYSVSVSARAPSIPSPEGGPPTPGELLTPAKYASTSTSGLRYQVRAGKNTIDIALSGEEAEPTEDAATETDSEKETATVEIAEVDESATGDSEATIE